MSGSPLAPERTRVENRVLTEMTGLALSAHNYDDAIQAILDLVEQVVVSPLLALSIQEDRRPGHYLRTHQDVDPQWADEAARYLVEAQNHHVARSGPRTTRVLVQHSHAPPVWLVSFLAETRSGRIGSLALASPSELTVLPEEEQVMLRVMSHALLVLDHALLLKRIENLETTDELTGIANHRRLVDLLEYEIHRHRYNGKWLALLVLDVSGLEGINRTYGHGYGNHILRKLGSLVGGLVRPIDTVARYGLDEFAVLLPEMDEEEAQTLAEKLHERFLAVEFAGGTVGLCAGVAHLKPDEALTAEAFLWRAEQALHEAKRQEHDWSVLWQSGSHPTR